MWLSTLDTRTTVQPESVRQGIHKYNRIRHSGDILFQGCLFKNVAIDTPLGVCVLSQLTIFFNMASLRALRPLARQTYRLVARPAVAQTRRYLNVETAPVLTTAHATVTGARAEGHVKGDYLDLNLDMPKGLGGEGKYSNPEELLAAAYGACFQASMNVAARSLDLEMPKDPKDYSVETDLHLVGSMKGEVDLGVRIDMRIKAKGIKKEDLEKVIAKSRETCPYSRAMKGNVITSIEAIAL